MQTIMGTSEASTTKLVTAIEATAILEWIGQYSPRKLPICSYVFTRRPCALKRYQSVCMMQYSLNKYLFTQIGYYVLKI